MQKLVDGIHRFQTHVFSRQEKFFQQLARGQRPSAMMITCADSRINPNLITQTEPGEIFILRNVGNIIPPNGTTNNGEAAAVEFAVMGLEVKDIIVCGHSHCGAMKAVINPKALAKLPATQEWLKHAAATQNIISENYRHLKGEAKLTAAAEENVLVQIQQLETLPCVASRCARGDLRIHAWMYKIETGQVFEYDWDVGQFILLNINEQKLVKKTPPARRRPALASRVTPAPKRKRKKSG